MNLALFDPFRRQIPDRIDSTLTVPRPFHPRRPKLSNNKTSGKKENNHGNDTATKTTTTTRKSSSGRILRMNKHRDSIDNTDNSNHDNNENGVDEDSVNNNNIAESDVDNNNLASTSSFVTAEPTCYAVSFNRRGTYLAGGHLSGALSVHDFASRTLSSVAHPPFVIEDDDNNSIKSNNNDTMDTNEKGVGDEEDNDDNNNNNNNNNDNKNNNINTPKSKTKRIFTNGVTTVSWSRRSRTCLIGSIGDNHICLIDNTHPFGPDDVSKKMIGNHNNENNNNETSEDTSTPKSNRLNNNKSPMNSNNVDLGLDRCSTVSIDMDYDTSHHVGKVGVPFMDKTSEQSSINQPILKRARIVSKLNIVDKTTLKNSVNDGLIKTNISTVNNVEITSSSKESSTSQPTAKKFKFSMDSVWYQKIIISLPRPILSSAQIHPSGLGGLACIDDGSLVLYGLSDNQTFHVNSTLSEDSNNNSTSSSPTNLNDQCKLYYLVNNSTNSNDSPGQESYFVTCATFDPYGRFIYAATKCGTLLVFQLSFQLDKLLFNKEHSIMGSNGISTNSDVSVPLLTSKVPGKAEANQIVCCRNGSFILINSNDSTLRLYDTKAILEIAKMKMTLNADTLQNSIPPISLEPKFSFQDVMSRCKWASCDFSGDGEYIVGGCNNNSGNKYELFVWNTATGTF